MSRIFGKCLAIALSISLALMMGGCDRAPKQYEHRMKYAGGDVWIDTETGVCYWTTYKGGTCVMVNQDGTPFIANGWRDNGE